MRIAYLGPEGTFSHEALVGAGAAGAADLVSCTSIRDAVLAVQDQVAERALVPIENSLEGAVNATLDTLVREAPDSRIVGEIVHPVRHCLVAASAVPLDAVTAVLSHPQPSAQSARFLRRRLAGARVIVASSTAEAIRTVVSAPPEPVSAAIGTRAAARRYGAVVLAEGIEDEPGNETRFVWLARAGTHPDAAATGPAAGAPAAATRPTDHEPDDAAAPHVTSAGVPGAGASWPGTSGPGAPWKTSLVFWGAGSDAPGWLVRCLSEFAFRGVNLTRIESRPRRDRLGSYIFFLDLDGATTEAPVADAIEALAAQTETVRVLGSYPAAATTVPGLAPSAPAAA